MLMRSFSVRSNILVHRTRKICESVFLFRRNVGHAGDIMDQKSADTR